MVMLFNLRLGQSVARARAHANAPPLKEESRKSTASTNRSPGLATKFGTDMSRTKEKSTEPPATTALTGGVGGSAGFDFQRPKGGASPFPNAMTGFPG